MFYTVYKTTNTINGKCYIGFHSIKTIDKIITYEPNFGSVFADGYLGSGKLMKAAIIKYGPENFIQEILFVTQDKDEAELMESSLVDRAWVDSDDNYNLSLGGNICILFGEKNGFYGKTHTQQTKARILNARNKTKSIKNFNFAECRNPVSGEIFYNRKEIIKAYSITAKKSYVRFYICELVFTGKLEFKSKFLQERAIKYYEEKINFFAEKEDRKREFSNAISKRFKGIPKTRESNEKRGESIKKWISENQDSHEKRMEKINKNPEKIRKTAEKHRGMKRSPETCRKISEALKTSYKNKKDSTDK